MALNDKDLAAVVSDQAKVRDNIRRGFKTIQLIGNSLAGTTIRQSETFLKRLIRATLRENEKV